MVKSYCGAERYDSSIVIATRVVFYNKSPAFLSLSDRFQDRNPLPCFAAECCERIRNPKMRQTSGKPGYWAIIEMKLHLLGTAGYHPNEHRHTACFMIPEAGIVFDAGTGFFRVRDLIETPELHIFLSHAHLDHCVGLTYLLAVLHDRDVRGVFVYGESEKLQAIREHLFSKHLFPIQPEIQCVELTDKPVKAPIGGTLVSFPLVHPGGCRGYRVDWPGHSVAYVTDTTATDESEYIRKIEGVDLLLHECNFADDQREFAKSTGHSCLTDVARLCVRAQVGRAVLIHRDPIADETLDLSSVQHLFDRIVLGEDLMIVEF